MSKKAMIIALGLLGAGTVASVERSAAQMQMDGMSVTQPKGDTSAPSQAFNAAMVKMDQGMDIAYTGDADKDFVAGMIPHHQGAIDMANVELKYGKDPELRKLAGEIVSAQEKEIALMQEWQARHSK